ncbi:Transmembrane protein 50A [Zea mays]|uniref:Transmembrane protein 50A n=1 Tax=Zea mays TaxID=4577 RepID=A0A1D6ERB2_MAIZE|nr:Transmembrane protein 50A [Zea mays]
MRSIATAGESYRPPLALPLPICYDSLTRPWSRNEKAAGVKLWLFVAYVVSFVCLAGSVGLLVQDALTNKGPSVWTGVAGVLQCVLVLISGLVYWTCHSED